MSWYFGTLEGILGHPTDCKGTVEGYNLYAGRLV